MALLALGAILVFGFLPITVSTIRRLDANGLDAWAQVVANGWAGLVAKDEASPYVPGAHTRRWIKVKHRIRQGWPGEGVEYQRE